MAKLTVRDLMTEDVKTVTPKTNMASVYDIMSSRQIRHLPVVDEDGELLGLLTHRDFLSRTISAWETTVSDRQLHLREVTVDEVMSRGIETTGPDQLIEHVARLMLEQKFGCLPVVEGNRLVGILTEADFVRHMAENS